MPNSSVGSALYGIFYFLFMSAVILGAAYLATKFIAKKGMAGMGNKNLKVVETLSLGLDKSLLLVKAGEQYLLLGSTQKGITLLSELPPEKLVLANSNELDFEAYLNNLEIGEEKSRSSNTIKHSLDKLKSLVRGNRSDV